MKNCRNCRGWGKVYEDFKSTEKIVCSICNGCGCIDEET
jgi:hypothetical protein